jgi:hypothetical protein
MGGGSECVLALIGSGCKRLPGPLKIWGEVTLGIRTYFGPKFVKVGWVRTYFDPSGTHVGRGRPNIFGPGSRHPGTDYVLPFRDAL